MAKPRDSKTNYLSPNPGFTTISCGLKQVTKPFLYLSFLTYKMDT